MSFESILGQHQAIQDRRDKSEQRLLSAREEFGRAEFFSENSNICVFAAGSLGRLDSGSTSDLDVFVTASGDPVGRLREIEAFAAILKINTKLEYPALSNDGQFLKIFNIAENEPKIGSANDDTENWFTTRMLLLLESNFLCNEKTYIEHKQRILQFYFRDQPERDGFKPLFLMNDILRYWRTLCLNYEQARSISGKSWKKRNFNLKFSRLLSVYGTVLPLMLAGEIKAEKIQELSSFTPMERLAKGLDLLQGAEDLLVRFPYFLDNYEHFLRVKETNDFDKVPDEVREDLKIRADYVAQFVFDALNHESVPAEFRRYLVI